MPDTTTASPRTLTVQPREIRETAFRALFSAGADPAEAQEGAEAVLRLEAEAGGGIALLPTLVGGHWQPAAADAAGVPTPLCDVAVFAHDGHGQAALRTLIQMVDLVIEHADNAGTVIAYNRRARLPAGLCAALAARASVLTNRSAAVAVVKPSESSPDTSTFRHSAGDPAAPSAQAEAAAALAANWIADGGTAVILLPQGPEQPDAPMTSPHLALTVDAEQWRTSYRLAGAYLVSDR